MDANIKTHTERLPPIHLLMTLAMLAHGCAALRDDLRREVIQQVSFDHNCPPQQIKILREEEAGLGRVWGYRLDVCGRERRYRNVGDDNRFYVDMTDGGSPVATTPSAP